MDLDPRVYFAAERTLLAWVRTGLTVMGLGFVVARFGVFLKLLRDQQDAASPTSTAIGVLLVLLGAAAIGMAAWQHTRFSQTLPADERPRRYWLSWSLVFALMLTFSGIALAGYLLMGPG